MSDIDSISDSDTFSEEEVPETSDIEFINDGDTDYYPSEDEEESEVESDDSYFERKALKRKLEEDAEKRIQDQEERKQMKDLLFKHSQQLDAINRGLDTLEKFKPLLENTKAIIPNVGSVPPPLDKSPAEANAENQ